MNNKFTIIILIFLILLSLNLIYNQTKSYKNITIEYMDEKINKLEKLYSQTRLKSPFEKQPEDNSGLHFGFICPGAIKTVTYLNKYSNTPKTKQLTQEVKKYTDAQFFIEIIIIYQDYISKKLFKDAKKIINNNGCVISNKITQKISDLFGQYPKTIKTNIPDDFYHIRHNTLICSNNRKLAQERISLLKSIYSS